MARQTGGRSKSAPAILSITVSERANLYTTKKATKYLGYKHPGSVRKLVSQKKLHPIKIGRDLLFFKGDLDNYNDTLRQPRGPRPGSKRKKTKMRAGKRRDAAKHTLRKSAGKAAGKKRRSVKG